MGGEKYDHGNNILNSTDCYRSTCFQIHFRYKQHFLFGWILLTIANILPGINVPINIITLAISGFGGVIGTILLAIFYLIF